MNHELWSVVIVVSLAGWIASTLLLIFKAFPEKGRFEVRPGMIWGGCVLMFFLAWTVGLVNA